MTLFRVEHKKNYTTVNNYIFTDSRLSWKAKAIWMYAFSRPDDWTFHMNDIVNKATDGRESVRAGLKELENCGYLHRDQKRDNGQFSAAEWVFYETPHEFKKSLPKTENLTTGNQMTGNRPLLSTEEQPSTEDKQQQQKQQPASPVVVFSEKAEKAATAIHDCLKDVEIPIDQKQWLSERYSRKEVAAAIAWTETQSNLQCLTAAIKWACKKKPNIPKKSMSVYEELALHFENGKFYNDAECILTSEVISFQRTMKHHWITLNEFFSWKKLEDICIMFGINFSRENGIV